MSHIVYRKGKRVALLVRGVKYLDLMLKWFNDEEVTKFILHDDPMTIIQERKYLESEHERQATDKAFVIAACEGKDYKPIGVMGLHRIDMRHRFATSGAVIGEKIYWGQGFGRDAKMLLLDLAFNQLNLRMVSSSVIEFNERSRKYNERCGYRVVGAHKERYWKKDRYHDEVIMDVTKEEWLPLWTQFVANGRTMKP